MWYLSDSYRSGISAISLQICVFVFFLNSCIFLNVVDQFKISLDNVLINITKMLMRQRNPNWAILPYYLIAFWAYKGFPDVLFFFHL